MKDYTIEEIYNLCGQFDRTSNVTFKSNSISSQKFGISLVGYFIFNQNERTHLEKIKVEQSNFNTTGTLRFKVLPINKHHQSFDIIEFQSNEIQQLYYYASQPNNEFTNIEIREINYHKINFNANYRDTYSMYYHMLMYMVKNQFVLIDDEVNYLIALNSFFNSDHKVIDSIKYQNYIIDEENIGLYQAEINYYIENDINVFFNLLKKRANKNIDILKNELNNAGISIKKDNVFSNDDFIYLTYISANFKDERLNYGRKYPVFWDLKAFLHILLRHTNELNIKSNFATRTPFQYYLKDITNVVKAVLDISSDAIQEHFANTSNKEFIRNNQQAVYFKGDYYNFRIDKNGRLSMFHKLEKKL